MVEQYISKMWRTHEPVAITIDWFKCDNSLENQPIFILDNDATYCAHSLITEHIKKYIEYIVYSMIMFRGTEAVINKSGASEKPRVDYMFYNQRTAYWFYTLYKEMQEIYKNRFGRYYKVSEYFRDSWLFDMNRIKGPMNVKHKAHKGARLPNDTCIREYYKDIYEPYASTIDKISARTGRFRVMYMIMGYLNSEFPSGAPAWYNNMKATIWKSFNKMTRLYYRIDTSVDGVYTYYYSVDDKNWIEIKDIPFELRGLIDGIIFAREV